VVMYGGRIVEEGRAADLFERPLHPYTAALIRSTPRLADRRERLQSIDGAPPNLLTLAAGCAFAARCPLQHAPCSKDPPLIAVDDGRRAACWLLRPQGAAMPSEPVDA
jgi:oligopeptide/dipeptide ABC transporter ATP-binding protein